MSNANERHKQKQREANKETTPFFGVKHLINGEIKTISFKANRKRNKQRHRPPKILYGFNTNK